MSSRCGRIYLVPPSGAPARELTGVSSNIARVAFDREGRRLAAGGGGEDLLRVFDLETGEPQTLDQAQRTLTVSLDFTREGRLLAGSYGRGLRLWNLESGTSELLLEGNVVSEPSPDGRLVALTLGQMRQNPSGKVYIFDLGTSTLQELPAHGDEVIELAWDPSGTHLVTASQDGTVRYGPVDGGEPHLLLGHEDDVWNVAFDPTGEWIASASADGTVRLWPTPRGEPLHTLPYDELMKRLSALTNYRVVEDDDARNGFTLDFESFPGWDREPPTW